jgi:GNAT superfamily N-acetyltransferase
MDGLPEQVGAALGDHRYRNFALAGARRQEERPGQKNSEKVAAMSHGKGLFWHEWRAVAVMTDSTGCLRQAQGRGPGSPARPPLFDALTRVEEAAETAGIRAAAVPAADEEAKRFYQRFGFEASPLGGET